MSDVHATPPDGDPQARPRSLRGRAWEWLTRGRALRAAVGLDAAQRGLRERARVARALGDACMESDLPGGTGLDDGAPALAVSLYREAIYWALAARDPGARHPDLAAALAANGELVGSDAVREALVGRSFVETAALDLAAQWRDAALGADLARALLEGLEARERIVRGRWARLGGIALAAALAVVGAGQLFGGRRVDRAEDSAWRASSAIEGFLPTGRGVSAPVPSTQVFVHTRQEPSPWVEFDLGAVASVRSVVVENRADCCQERAIPLVIELSTDALAWSQTARRDEVFGTWTAGFSPRRARYVRLRVLSPTYLHLKSVAIF